MQEGGSNPVQHAPPLAFRQARMPGSGDREHSEGCGGETACEETANSRVQVVRYCGLKWLCIVQSAVHGGRNCLHSTLRTNSKV